MSRNSASLRIPRDLYQILNRTLILIGCCGDALEFINNCFTLTKDFRCSRFFFFLFLVNHILLYEFLVITTGMGHPVPRAGTRRIHRTGTFWYGASR